MRTPSRTGSLPFRLLGLGLAAALCGACKTAPLPGSDDTPPAIDWFVRNTTTDAVLEFSGNGGPILVNPGDQFHVTCFARAPGGVSEISPTVNSPCECHYEGRSAGNYPDGPKFDSSYDRGSPTTFAPNQGPCACPSPYTHHTLALFRLIWP